MLRFGTQLYLLISPALVLGRALIDEKVLEELESSGTTRIIVEFEETKEHRDLRIKKNPIKLSEEDYEKFVTNLQNAAASAQGPALDHIAKSRRAKRDNGESIKYKVFTIWSTNELSIANADKRLVEELAETARVTKIVADAVLTRETPPIEERALERASNVFDSYYIKMVKANQVWDKGVNGHGVVVGVIDSGVHLGHDLLGPKWRKEYGWFDTIGLTRYPRDEAWDSHGTAVAGLMVAGKQKFTGVALGVAPGAKFIACRTDRNGTLSCSNMKSCMDFMACPTNTDGYNRNCRMRPQIVNHSVGRLLGSIDHRYFHVYVSAGITVIQAAGNFWGNCSSLLQEAQLPEPITVSSVKENRERSKWCGSGPTKYPDHRIKPDVMAPGELIYVCTNSPNTKYPSWGYYGVRTGTSTASPIVAGIAALLLSANPSLNPEDIKKIIQQTAEFNVKKQWIECNDFPWDYRPNYVIGYGIVNAFKAYQEALKVPCKTSRRTSLVPNSQTDDES